MEENNQFKEQAEEQLGRILNMEEITWRKNKCFPGTEESVQDLGSAF